MKYKLSYVFGLALLVATSVPVLAQDYNRGTKQELDDVEQLYPKRSKTVSDQTTTQVDVTRVRTQQVQPAAAPVATTTLAQQQAPQAPAAQPIYILQQPTTNIDSTPVKESRAEQLRKQREEVEHQNENKLIERLEDERLNAEKDRVDKILNPIAAPAPVPHPEYQAPLEQRPVPQPQAVIIQKEEIKETVEPVAAEVKVKEDLNKEEKKEEHGKMAIGGLVGVGNYPSASNVNGAYALGGIVEYTLPNRIAIEGTVAFSSYDIQNNNGFCYYCGGGNLVSTMNQWDITGGVKYKFLPGQITPVVGGLLGFTRRDYKSRVSWGFNQDSGTGSNAFDGGFLIGAELHCSENVTVGADFRYMMNISYRTDNPLAYGFYNQSVYLGSSPIETFNYYIAGINTRISF